MRREGEGESVTEICAAAQIPRRTFYNWRHRYRQGGLERLLNDKPKTADTIHRTPEEVVAKVTHLRLETGWCPHKIAGYLTNQNMQISHMTATASYAKQASTTRLWDTEFRWSLIFEFAGLRLRFGRHRSRFSIRDKTYIFRYIMFSACEGYRSSMIGSS